MSSSLPSNHLKLPTKQLKHFKFTLPKSKYIHGLNGHFGREKADKLAKGATIEGTTFNLQKPISFLKKTLVQLSLESWQREWVERTTSHYTFDVLQKVSLIYKQWCRNEILFLTGHGPLPSYFKGFGLAVSDNYACADVGTPYHYAAACPLPFPFFSKLLQQFINFPGFEFLFPIHM
ncbi:hypothetical protein AVEN_174508-1 [Araneus ventricosus]|uniref:Uncharacterized protein n=1 Tax=Araneus ventricosus TaxID=182803 RepID=A0A4Y2TBG5_ARAVE|nr:hypothetical protein AVEN_174508-1 [Araneus ventricosus]